MVSAKREFSRVEKLIYNLVWKFHRRTGMDFEELKSEAYMVYMKCCASFEKEKGAKFSSWVGYKINRHLLHYQRQKLKDRLTFVDEVRDDLLKPSTALKHSLLDQLSGLSREAQQLVQLLIETPHVDIEDPKTILADAVRELRCERGFDDVYTKIILHEIKEEIAAVK